MSEVCRCAEALGNALSHPTMCKNGCGVCPWKDKSCECVNYPGCHCLVTKVYVVNYHAYYGCDESHSHIGVFSDQEGALACVQLEQDNRGSGGYGVAGDFEIFAVALDEIPRGGRGLSHYYWHELSLEAVDGKLRFREENVPLREKYVEEPPPAPLEVRPWEVWSEGFVATGESGTARLMGTIDAKTFAGACRLMAKREHWGAYFRLMPHPSFWGCRLFDNEADARKAFG